MGAPGTKGHSQNVAASENNDGANPADQGWHVDIAPYLWFAGINGTVGALDHEVSVHASASDVLSYLNFGLMGAVEARYNRIIIPVDFMWVRVKDDKGIPITDDVESVNTKISEYIFTPKGWLPPGGQRPVQNGCVVWAALLAHWNGADLAAVRNQQWYLRSGDWVDAVAGGRFQASLTPKVALTIAGDAGGGGSKTTLDYQVPGLPGYQVKRVTLEGGW
jgi:hypothetical protein